VLALFSWGIWKSRVPDYLTLNPIEADHSKRTRNVQERTWRNFLCQRSVRIPMSESSVLEFSHALGKSLTHLRRPLPTQRRPHVQDTKSFPGLKLCVSRCFAVAETKHESFVLAGSNNRKRAVPRKWTITTNRKGSSTDEDRVCQLRERLELWLELNRAASGMHCNRHRSVLFYAYGSTIEWTPVRTRGPRDGHAADS